MKKLITISALAAAFALSLSAAAFADGWAKENNQWVYYQNGIKVTNDWRTSADGGYYYLDSYGNMLVNSFVDYERYVDADGRMVTAAWRQIDGKWYYFDTNGKLIRNKSKQINGVYYFFDYEGCMSTGWVEDDSGDWYYCDPGDGHRITSAWKKLEPDESMAIDYSEESTINEDGTYWYYFQSSGKMTRADSSEYKEAVINGARYAFDEYGRMTTGWVKLNDTTPAIAGWKYYNDSTSLGTYGAAHTGWLSAYPPENADLGSDVAWYYFDSRGVPYHGTDVGSGDDDETLVAKFRRLTINGKTNTYLFNEYGNPVYGLRKVYRSNGTVTSMYFGTKQESCLQLGEKNITEADGTVSVFHFESNGYGTNGVKNGRLYYMGKLQKAYDDTYAYYTVNGTTWLVNKSGNVVKNHNRRKDPTDVEYRSDSSGHKDGGTESDSELNAPEFVTTEL